MVYLSLVVIALAVSSVSASPAERITLKYGAAQAWFKACKQAGGGSLCETIALNSSQALLPGSDVCDQQNAADDQVALAKILSKKYFHSMINASQIYVQQPRNSSSVMYCERKPIHSELKGYYPCQFSSYNQTLFTNGTEVGEPGTFPFGHGSALSPPGSCPAYPKGPIPDGKILSDLVNKPGKPDSLTLSTTPPTGSSTPPTTPPTTPAVPATTTSMASSTPSTASNRTTQTNY